MSVITFGNKKNDNNIICFNNENKYNITSNIINEMKLVDEKNKILYFNYSYSENELKNNFDIFNNKNIIIVNKQSVSIDDLDKYLKYSKPKYVCIDYFKMVDRDTFMYIDNNRLKYVLDKLEKYSNKYNIIFIVGINLEVSDSYG